MIEHWPSIFECNISWWKYIITLLQCAATAPTRADGYPMTGDINRDVLDVSGERPYIRVSGWVARRFAFRYRVKDTTNGDVYIHLCAVCVCLLYIVIVTRYEAYIYKIMFRISKTKRNIYIYIYIYILCTLVHELQRYYMQLVCVIRIPFTIYEHIVFASNFES